MDKDFERGRNAASNEDREFRSKLAANKLVFECECRSLYERINNTLGSRKKFRVHFGPAPGYQKGFSEIYIDTLTPYGKKTLFGRWRPGYKPTYGVRVCSNDLKEIDRYDLCYARQFYGDYGNPKGFKYDEDSTLKSAQTVDEFMMKLGEYFGNSI